MNGSRRVRAASVLPRYGSASLFKGHLSTKSNAFCTDSSSLRLSTLHLVKNHMAVHYNKILSAKAKVDCSVPLSMSTSIKYADQQRREKLKKEVERCERELRLTKTEVQANSKNNSKSLFNTLQKPSGEPQNEDGLLIKEMNGCPSFSRSPVTSERLHQSLPKSNKRLTNGAENSSPILSSTDDSAGPRRLHSGASHGRRPRNSRPDSHRFQLVISKAPSGDLLDKHSELFSNRHLPFTPRTLKTEAKSYLSQYRYYTPAKRKKDGTNQRIEAETQTELSSFKSDFEAVETKNFTDSEVNIKQASSCMTYDPKGKITPSLRQGHGSPWGEVKGGSFHCSPPRSVSQYSLQLPPRRKIYSDEEELLYLSFIEDITDEILELGLFSNRFLEQLFERHIRQNKHHLEEGKMRHLLHILKVNLGCISKENSVKLDEVDLLNLLDFEKTENSEQNEYKNEQDAAILQERQEYQKPLDVLLSAHKDENETLSPNELFLPVYKSEYSEGVTIHQANDETNLGPSIWDENNPSTSESLIGQGTSVNVPEGGSDTEKVELCCLSTTASPSVQLCHDVRHDRNHDVEGPALKIMEMSIEDCPLDV